MLDYQFDIYKACVDELSTEQRERLREAFDADEDLFEDEHTGREWLCEKENEDEEYFEERKDVVEALFTEYKAAIEAKK